MSYLWCDVVWGSTECRGGLAGKHSFLTHTKICDLTVTLCIKKDVVQLQVSTNAKHFGSKFVFHICDLVNKIAHRFATMCEMFILIFKSARPLNGTSSWLTMGDHI